MPRERAVIGACRRVDDVAQDEQPSKPGRTETRSTRSASTALVEDGIPYTSFALDDVAAEYTRLSSLGVRFTQEPVDMGPVRTAVFDDTCDNLIQIATRRG